MAARPLRGARLAGVAACLAGIALVLTARPSEAAGTFRTIDAEGLRIIIDSEWGQRLAPGYLPVRLDITNLADARVLTFSVSSNRYSSYGRRAGVIGRTYSSGRRTTERTIELPRGARARFTMAMPISAENENMQFTVREDDRVLQMVNLGNVQSDSDAPQAAVLIVAGSGSSYAQQASGWARPMPTPPSYGGPKTLIDVVLEPQRLPAAWVGYSSLRAVVIGGTEWQQLTDDQRSALRRWTAAGGDLIVVDADPGATFAAGIPLGSAEPSRSSVHYLLGSLHRVTSSELTSSGLEEVLRLLPPPAYGLWRLPIIRLPGSKIDDDHGGFLLPIPGIGQVHARGYLMLLLLFAVLIGPINYVFLRRRGLQPLLVVTAPLIAVVFLMLLGTYVVAGEGFSVHARAATFTLLDQQRQEAITRSSVSIYAAGRTPGDGLQFAPDTAVYPFDPEDGQDDIHIALDRGQQFDSGLVRARTPSNFETVEWRTVRQRLTFSRQGDTLSVSNGLGATVSQLLVRAGTQMYQLSAPLGPGGQAALRVTSAHALSPVPMSHPLYARFQEAAANQPANSYLAIIDRQPFWSPGIANVAESSSVHLILGLGEPLP